MIYENPYYTELQKIKNEMFYLTENIDNNKNNINEYNNYIYNKNNNISKDIFDIKKQLLFFCILLRYMVENEIYPIEYLNITLSVIKKEIKYDEELITKKNDLLGNIQYFFDKSYKSELKMQYFLNSIVHSYFLEIIEEKNEVFVCFFSDNDRKKYKIIYLINFKDLIILLNQVKTECIMIGINKPLYDLSKDDFNDKNKDYYRRLSFID